LAAEALLRDLAAEAPEPDLAAEALLRDLGAEAPEPDWPAEAAVRDLAAEAPVRDLAAEAPVRDLAVAVARLPPLDLARVRAALRAAVERVAAFWLRVRAALRAAVLRSPRLVWLFSSCTSPSRRSTASRRGFGACLPFDTWAGSSDSSRATLFRSPWSRILLYSFLSCFAFAMPNAYHFPQSSRSSAAPTIVSASIWWSS
jgi:hypothetical protein